eukprot:6437191-Pyramimonas_sp.AAC.1
MVRRGKPDSPRLTEAGVWLIRVRAPSSRGRPLVCVREAQQPPAGSLCAHIVSESRCSGAQRCNVLTWAGGCGCATRVKRTRTAEG